MTKHGPGPYQREAEATARLIQHAPALYYALDALMGGDDKMQVAIGGNPNYVDKFLARARAILDEIAGDG